MLGVTRRKLQTPGTAEEHKRQETPTSNPIDRQPARLTDQAPRTVERAARETHKTNYHSSCACFTTTATRHHHPHPTGSSPDPLSQRSPLRSLGALHRRAEPHHTTDTTHLSGDTQRPPHLGGPSSGVADGQPRAHGLLLSKGRWRGEGGGGSLQQYGLRRRSGLQVPNLVRRRPRAGAETSGKTISWSWLPRRLCRWYPLPDGVGG